MINTNQSQTMMPHQHILYDYLNRMHDTGGFHLVDFSTGGGKTFVCLKYWCEIGHTHYKRMFFVLPQHKNIQSAIHDFEYSAKQAQYSGHYLRIKSSNGIEDFLARIESSQLLKELLAEIKQLVESNKGSSNNQSGHLHDNYRKFESALEDLSGYCHQQLNKDSREKIGEIEARLRANLKFILLSTCDLIERPEEESACIENIQKALKKVPTLDKIYPIVHLHEYPVVFMTASKTAYKIDPIVNPIFSLYGSRFVTNNLLVFDEFDTDYQELRNHLFSPLGEVLAHDLLSLFDQLRTALIEVKSKMVHDQQLEEVFQTFHGVAEQYLKQVEKVYADYAIPPLRELYYQSEGKQRPYIFKSMQSGVVFPKNVLRYMIQHNSQRNALELVSKQQEDRPTPNNEEEDPIEEPEDELSLTRLIRRILSLLRNFGRTLGECSEQMYHARLKIALQRECENQPYVLPLQSAVDNETLRHFQITKREKNGLYLVIYNLLRNHTNKQSMPFIPDDSSVFNLGAYHMTIREISHFSGYYEVDWNEIKLTPERCFYNCVANGNNTVLALSATGSIASYSTNACMDYLHNQLLQQFHTPTDAERKQFDEAYKQTQPSLEERPVICGILPELTLPKEESNPFSRSLPSYPAFEELFPKEEWPEAHRLIAELHNRLKAETHSFKDKRVPNSDEDALFYMNRYYQLLYVVRQLLDNEQIYSGITFCNNLPNDSWLWKEELLLQLADHLSGSAYSNPLLILKTDSFDDTMERFREEVARGEKRMLLTSYRTTSIGMNLVHRAPNQQELTGKLPPYWANDPDKAREKDIDMIVCQDVTNYIMQQSLNLNSKGEKEYNMLNPIFFLMVMHYNGQLSTSRMRLLIQKLCTHNFEGIRKDDRDFLIDRLMYKLGIIKQAIGRGCRRTIKGKATYIYISEGLVDTIRIAPINHSYGVEFRALMDFVKPLPMSLKLDQLLAKRPLEIRLNQANTAQEIYRKETAQSIHYYHDTNAPDVDMLTQVAQQAIERKRQLILCHPTYDQLPDDTVVSQLYIDFGEPVQRYAYKAGPYGLDGNITALGLNPNEETPSVVDEQHVYLPALMRCQIVREHFERNDIPTHWTPGRYILPPYLMLNIYKGCIGEEALRAILLMLFPDDQFVSYKGINYEVADLHSVKRQIAFDAKNYSYIRNYEGQADHATNMRFKAEKLGHTVLFVQLVGESRPDVVEKIGAHLYAIPGIIDAETGALNQEALRFLRKIYEQAPQVENEESQTPKIEQ